MQNLKPIELEISDKQASSQQNLQQKKFGPRLKQQKPFKIHKSKINIHGNQVFDILQNANDNLNHKTLVAKQESLVNEYNDIIQNEIPLNLQGNDYIFDTNYGTFYDNLIFKEQPEYTSCLKNHSIREILRAKMVDWMIEVFYNFNHVSEQTYFRAVSMMDLYFKLCTKKLKDQDVHLIGIGCIFLSTKIEDIYHIDLQSIIERVGHKKYSAQQIKEIEWEILVTLKFNVLFANHLTHVLRFHYIVTNQSDSQTHQNIKETSKYILKMCLHDYKMLIYPIHILAFTIVKFSITLFFESFIEEENLKVSDEQIKYKDLLNKRLDKVSSQYNTAQLTECFNEVVNLSKQFQTRFPELKNLQQYSN